jgi:hypothetical protein
MGMGCTRVGERVLAALGKLSAAPSRFRAALDVTNGGVLWALPALLTNGLLRHTKACFDLPNGYYSTVHIFLLLAYMALCRIKSNEQLRYSPPGELGLLLGLDRIPEVRTLRGKIKDLSQQEQVEQWAAVLSEEWMAADPEAVGTLYVDGHVRVYHGSQTKLPIRYVPRERLCLRGMTDYWVNDQQGRPFFVISTPFTSGLLEMLRNRIVPRLLEEVPDQPTQQELDADPQLHRFTLVFDREGYSPAFFKQMWEPHRIACMTYHKYPKRDWSEAEFHPRTALGPQGEEMTMKLAERGTYLGEKGKGLWVRELRKLSRTGHQTAVVSTEYRAEAGSLGVRMFSRWCQENFFRYMMQHFNIDALIDYGIEPADETKQVVNPAYRKIESQIKSQAAKLGRKVREFGEINLSPVPPPKEIQVYETRKGNLIEEIHRLEKDLSALKKTRRETCRHVSLDQLPETDRFSQLAPARKAFMDTIKMIAYRAETAMAAILRDSLARPDDARALLRDIFTTQADLHPNQEQGTLTVRLHHLTNRLSDQAAHDLAEFLNTTETVYPGTNLRLCYELVSE